MEPLGKLSQNFVATRVDDEVLIVDLDGGELFSLSGTARSVWEAIDGTRTEREIADRMTREHEGDAGVIAADVTALVHQLKAAALLA